MSGAHDWNRTSDLLLTKEVLYRLSYVGGVAFSDTEAVNGAGDGNRTRTIGLEGRSSTIELLPHRADFSSTFRSAISLVCTRRERRADLVEGGGFEPPKA